MRRKRVYKAQHFIGNGADLPLGTVAAAQVAILYATVHGYLKDIAVKDIAAYESALYQYLDENVTAGGVMEAIRTTGDMKQDTEQQMKDVLAAFTADFIKNAG